MKAKEIAGALGDPARMAMLFALLDGTELTASELAFRAGASPQAASAHLHRLVAAEMLAVRSAGRQRIFRLANPAVARAVEALAAIAPPTPVASLEQHSRMDRLRIARSCYDHLAGKLGVALMDSLHRSRAVEMRAGEFRLTKKGGELVARIGIDVHACAGRRALVRPCLDWTERRDHLAGSLAAAMLEHFIGDGWVARYPRDRALRVTPKGTENFARLFGIAAGE